VGRAQYEAFAALIEAAKRGDVAAMCTAPVSKEQISRAGIPFMGHTEVLAEAFGVEVVMLMKGPKLSVALATNHVPLAEGVEGALGGGAGEDARAHRHGADAGAGQAAGPSRCAG
jgi:4-hydroxy-L-threonine phosphate dehydrogenase PdxA